MTLGIKRSAFAIKINGRVLFHFFFFPLDLRSDNDDVRIFEESGTSIECYNCHSETDSNCAAQSPDVKYLTNCSALKEGPKYQACRKIENYVDFKVVGQEPTKRVIRQCAADVDKDRPCYYRAGFGGRANVCDCFESRCNFASTIINSVLVTAICAFAAFIFL